VAELRSFLIGVIVAGVLLGIVAVALGAFGGDDSDPTTARLISSPVATSTAQTSPGPDTTALPTLAATTQPSPTTAATAGATTEPTAAPTDTPAPEPTADPVSIYVAVVSPYVTDLLAQIDYVVGQGSANPSGSTQSAGIIKEKAAQVQNLSPPACLSSAHGTLSSGSGSASASADQLIAALDSGNDSLVQAALSGLSSARGTLAQGAAEVSSAPC
jgi:hypothetical protein